MFELSLAHKKKMSRNSLLWCNHTIKTRRKIVAKGKNTRKASKKKPQKTMKEKKQAKREKKDQNSDKLVIK